MTIRRLAGGGRVVDEAARVGASWDFGGVRLGESKGALLGDVDVLAAWNDGVHACARGRVNGAGLDGGGGVGECGAVESRDAFWAVGRCVFADPEGAA